MTAFQAQDPQFERLRVEPGACEIELPFREDLTQQKGFVTVEYKLNILSPGRGALVAKGQVVKPGRTLTVARAEVYSRDGRHVASMQQTLMMLPDTPDTEE